MLKSINELASIVGADRATVQRRADQLGLVHKDGQKQAKLYDSRTLLQLVPLPSRLNDDGDDSGMTYQDAKTAQAKWDAKCKELTAKKLEGSLVDVSELMEAQNELFDMFSALVKKSALSDNEKEDILSAFSQAARAWAE
jgi:hypothetical protein